MARKVKASVVPIPFTGIERLVKGWTLVGVWLPSEKEKQHPHYFLYQAIMMIIFMGFFQTALIVNFITIDNVGKSAEVLCTSITEMALFFKLIVILFSRKRILNLFEMLNHGLVADSGDEDELNCIKAGLKQSKQLHIGLLLGYLLSAVAAGLGAYLSEEITLPIPSWFPFDWRSNVSMYWISFSYQLLSMFVHSPILAGTDALPSCIMCIVSGYYEGLGSNLRKIGTNCFDDEEIFKKSVNKLVNIKKIIAEIETVFNFILMIQFSVGGFVMCLSVLQMSMMSFDEAPTRFGFMVIYLLAMSAAIFMPCYFGNEIQLKNAMVLRQIYNSNWTSLPKRFQKDLVIFMGSVIKDARIRAGGLFDANLKTFSSIVNFTFSLYTLLTSLEK